MDPASAFVCGLFFGLVIGGGVVLALCDYEPSTDRMWLRRRKH